MDYVSGFIKHCLADEEVRMGGIPTKEKYYFKKLGWKENDEVVERFYNAISELLKIRYDEEEKQKRKAKMYQ